MNKTFKEYLADLKDRAHKVNDRDIQVATIAVLTALAHSDSQFETEELNEIVLAMNEEFDLTDTEIGELLEIADFLRRDHKDLDDYLDMINATFDQDRKVNLLRLVWQVAGSDDTAEALEAQLAAWLRAKLGLSLEQAVRARTLVRERINKASREIGE